MPTTPAFIVSLKAPQNSSRLSQITDHSKAARTLMRNRSGRLAAATRFQTVDGLGGAVVLGRVPPRVPRLDPRTRRVTLEGRPEAPRNRVPEELPEHVAGPHAADRRVDPPLHVRLALADADPPGDVEEPVRRHLEIAVVGRDADEERVVVHECVGLTVLDGEHPGAWTADDLERRLAEAVLDPRVVDRPRRGNDPLASHPVTEPAGSDRVLDEQSPDRAVVRERVVDRLLTRSRPRQRGDDYVH